MRWILTALVLLYGCIPVPGTSINDEDFKCEDGRVVSHPRICTNGDTEPERAVPEGTLIAPARIEIGDTGIVAATEDGARKAFETYVNDNGYNYKLQSIEPHSEGYKVIYSHPEGRGMVIVGSDGRVYQEYGAI